MKSWEIVLIVLGVAIGVLCVFLVGKHMGSPYDGSDGEREKEADNLAEEDCMMMGPPDEDMMMGPPEEEKGMPPPEEEMMMS